jgi:DNA-binding transcriptional MocR family regulator
MSTVINELLEDNFLPKYINDFLVPEGRRRHLRLASAIKEHLGPFGMSFTPDPEVSPLAGGYYIWVLLPDALTAARVCEEALKRQNLVLGCGETFAVAGGDGLGDLHRRLRLCFMWEDEGRLVEGVERLGVVMREMLGHE